MVTPSWDELLQTVLAEQQRPASPARGSPNASQASSPAVSPSRPPRLPWDQRLEERREWRQVQLQEKWEAAAALRLARSEEFFDRTEMLRLEHLERAEEIYQAEVKRDAQIKAMAAQHQAEHLMTVRRQKQRRNEQQKQRKEAEREKITIKEQKEAARNARLLAKRQEMEAAMAEGGNLRKAESDIFDVLEAHKREREDWQSSAEALQSQNDRRAQAYKRKLAMALVKSRGEQLTRELTQKELASPLTEKSRGQGHAGRLDPEERDRLAELNRLKKRERELEERRAKVEAHRHIVEHHEAFHAAEARQADENWAQHEEDLLELQHMRATLPNRFTDDLKRRTVELGKKTRGKLERFKASQAKIRGEKDEYCRSFGEKLNDSMSKHEKRRLKLAGDYKERLQEKDEERTLATEACNEYIEQRQEERERKGAAADEAMDLRLATRTQARLDALQDSSAEFKAKATKYAESKQRRNDRFMMATAMESWRRDMQVWSKQQQKLDEVPYVDVRGSEMDTHTLTMWNTRKCGRLQSASVWRVPPVGEKVDIIKAVKMYRKSRKERESSTFLTATDMGETTGQTDDAPDSPKSSDGGDRQPVPLGETRPITPASPVLTRKDLVLTLTKAFMTCRGAAPVLNTPEDEEKWSEAFFSFMDVNSNGRISMGDLDGSLDALNLDPDEVLPAGLNVKNAYRFLMDPDGFVRKKRFVAYAPKEEEDELAKLVASATSPKSRSKPKAPAEEDFPEPEDEGEDEDKEDDEDLQVYLKEHRPKEPPDCSDHVFLPPEEPSAAHIAKLRARDGDKALIKVLENPRKVQTFSCGNGLDYLARKREGMDSQTAMLWVFTHHNNSNYAREKPNEKK